MTQSLHPRVEAASNPAVWSALITSAALVAQLVAGKATRDALFLTHFGVSLLPAAMIGAAVVSGISVLAVTRAMSAAGPARVLTSTFAISACLFGAAWALQAFSARAAALTLYAHTAIINLAIGSAFWSLVSERFDPHTAKRLVGRIAGAGTIGGMLGGAVVWGASIYRSVPAMLAVLAAMSAAGLWSSLRFARRAPKLTSTPPVTTSTSGLSVLRETPYLRDVAWIAIIAAATQALLDWLFSAHASQRYQGEALLSFFATFNMAVNVLSFVAQIFLTRWVLQKQGLGGAVKLQSASVAVAALASVLAPFFLPVIIMRVLEQVTRGSLYRSAYELFYTPLPSEKKRPTKMLIDVAVDRFGTALGSAVLFAIASAGAGLAAQAQLELQTRVTLLAVIALSTVAIYVAVRLQRGYVAALASSLRSGAIALEDDDTLDLTTRRTLAETSALLNRQDLLARIEAFQARKSERPDAQGAALPGAEPEDQVLALSLKLRDAAFEVRAEAALALAKLADGSASGAQVDREAVMDAVRAELDNRPSSRRLAHVFVVLGLALEREPLAIASRAVRSEDPALRGTAFEYLEVVLPADIRDRLMPLLGHVQAQRKQRRRGQRELAEELLKSRA